MKDKQLNVKVSAEQDRMLKEAAYRSMKTKSEFIRDTSLKEAEKVLGRKCAE